MSDLTNAIHLAVTTEYWKGPGYNETDMAVAAAEAAGLKLADTRELAAIIGRHLRKPDFIAMSVKLAEYLEGGFTVNGYRFRLARHRNGWVWVAYKVESLVFETQAEAQMDAIRYARYLEQMEQAA